jgi:hypothetical protein
MMTPRDRDMYFEAGAWERRVLGGTMPLSEGRVSPEDDSAILREARALFEAGLRGAPRELDEVRPSTQLELPAEGGADRNRPAHEGPLANVHARLAAAIEGRPYVPAPERARTTLLEAHHGGSVLPEGIHARVAAAIEGRPSVAVPEGMHRKLLEAVDGRPALPDGIHARLLNAL